MNEKEKKKEKKEKKVIYILGTFNNEKVERSVRN